ncbi:MAG: hypothetical protein RL291_1760 [Pseudomonadota bacterium]|jgi:uncharacterized protein (TIGR02246 family)
MRKPNCSERRVSHAKHPRTLGFASLFLVALMPASMALAQTQPPAPAATIAAIRPIEGPVAQPVAPAPGAQKSEKTATCGPKDKAAVTELLERWSSAVANNNAVRALSIYSEDAQLTTLGSQRPIVGRPNIRAHYTQQLRPNQALILASISARIDCTSAIVIGSYGILSARMVPTSLQASNEPPSPGLTPQRFRMRLIAQDGEWLVADHVLMSGGQIVLERDAGNRLNAGQGKPTNPVKAAAKRSASDPAAAPPTGQSFTWGSLVSMQ